METRKTFPFNFASFFQAERWFTVLWLAVCMLGAGIFAMAQSPRIIEFDAPGAGSTPGLGLGTQGVDITHAGAITGMSVDENNLGYGFVRAPDGTFTLFDDPDAGTTVPQRTSPLSINSAGVTAGGYWDASSVYHGFVRTPDGKFTNFDPPGSVFTLVCVASCINPAGTVNGWYQDADGVVHGFVRAPDGRITKFDVPGAGTVALSYQGTIPLAINAAGEITGAYIDSNLVLHGFLRLPGPPQF
jgi:hypothetical protein